MGKVYAMPVEAADDDKPRGTVRAFTTIQVVDMQGRERQRKVSLGALHYQSVDVARESMRSVRADNPAMQIHGQLTIDL